ncbi:hypothetical protein N7510_002548 [Penicillium lagena]|uniref:uncharacterized protein n=1 Tax=Penicillium lagena TaxID=94218 RepID=UPI00253FBFC9|nr:uncharacterized protein N7510_002548 [Penicillium lagena]KAJ5626239.1 hypothetical protein N7510_002548 [Penicillium lagena]
MTKRPAAKPLVLPAVQEDAAERKRVLNVLAQRRYRRRRRERLQALESKEKRTEVPRNEGTEVRTTSESISDLPAVMNHPVQYLDADIMLPPQEENPTAPSLSSSAPSMEVLAPFPPLAKVNPQQSFGLSPTDAWDPFLATTWPEWMSPSQTSNGYSDKLPSVELNDLDNDWDLSAALQADETSFFTFPDDELLEVPSLVLLNAAMKVAQRLNITDLLWDFTAVSRFYQAARSSLPGLSPPSLESSSSTAEYLSANLSQDTGQPMDVTELPTHLQPTRTQRLIPHHPILDLLPWPSTRDKLIHVFHLPPNLRPRCAQDPMALMHLVYDMEDDSGEGVRIHGEDPFEPARWEIGQVLFERWWWAFERSIVERSNRARQRRGQSELLLEGHQN